MDVLAIQARLKAIGFNPGPLDGDMGPQTSAAIKRFETTAKLKADGLIDPVFTAALFSGIQAKEPPWLHEARAMLGIREAPGTADSPDVIKMFADAGHPEVKHDATPWCAAFVGAALRRSGFDSTGSLWALDYLHWGVGIPDPELGCVAVKTRQGGGHVTFVVGMDGSRLFCLGGNQSDMVSIASYPKEVFTFRVPAGWSRPVPPLPLPRTITGARAGVKEA